VSNDAKAPGVTCKDFIELLADYLDAAYLRTYRRTSAAAGEVQRAHAPRDMPDEMKARLRAFLLARLARPR
jgi:hypothetical protein